MIILYFSGIILVSFIISLLIAYGYVRLIFLNTNKAITFSIFLKNLYHFTHFHNIWSGVRYIFRKGYTRLTKEERE